MRKITESTLWADENIEKFTEEILKIFNGFPVDFAEYVLEHTMKELRAQSIVRFPNHFQSAD